MRLVFPCLLLGLFGCVTPEPSVRPDGPGDVEGIIRQRDASCERGFRLAVGSTPAANRKFSVRAGRTPAGPELASFVTTDEGAFRAALPKGLACFVDVTVSEPSTCAAVLDYDPAREPTPLVFLPPAPCPR